jgi:hypothetical protein
LKFVKKIKFWNHENCEIPKNTKSWKFRNLDNFGTLKTEYFWNFGNEKFGNLKFFWILGTLRNSENLSLNSWKYEILKIWNCGNFEIFAINKIW